MLNTWPRDRDQTAPGGTGVTVQILLHVEIEMQEMLITLYAMSHQSSIDMFYYPREIQYIKEHRGRTICIITQTYLKTCTGKSWCYPGAGCSKIIKIIITICR